MPLEFSFTDLWAFYDGLEDEDLKAHLLDELTRDDWLFRQTEKMQTEVLKGAPESFIQDVASKLKPALSIKLGSNPFLAQWRDNQKGKL